MLQWLMRLLCRPVIIHGLDRTMTMYTENGHDTIMMITTDSPRLTVTPGEWYASDVFTQTSHGGLQRSGTLEDVSAGRDGKYGFPKIYCAAADSGAVEMNDLIFCRPGV